MANQINVNNGQKHIVPTTMITKYGLTEIQAAFCSAYLSNGLKKTESARQALQECNPELYERNKDNKRYWSMRANKLLQTTPVHEYTTFVLTNEGTTTIHHITTTLTKFLDDDKEDTKNRIKAAEILLKHYDGFNKHNQSKSPKHLTINKLDDKDLDAEIKKLTMMVSDDRDSTFDDDYEEATILDEMDEDEY